MLSRSYRLARPGMQPSWAQDPKATRTLAFFRSRWAKCSFSLLRMAPLNRQTSMFLSGMASTSLYLASTATGQKRISATSSTPRSFSRSSTMAISQPPQEAAQYRARLRFGWGAMSILLARQLAVTVQGADGADLLREIPCQLGPLWRLRARAPAPV